MSDLARSREAAAVAALHISAGVLVSPAEVRPVLPSLGFPSVERRLQPARMASAEDRCDRDQPNDCDGHGEWRHFAARHPVEHERGADHEERQLEAIVGERASHWSAAAGLLDLLLARERCRSFVMYASFGVQSGNPRRSLR